MQSSADLSLSTNDTNEHVSIAHKATKQKLAELQSVFLDIIDQKLLDSIKSLEAEIESAYSEIEGIEKLGLRDKLPGDHTASERSAARKLPALKENFTKSCENDWQIKIANWYNQLEVKQQNLQSAAAASTTLHLQTKLGTPAGIKQTASSQAYGNTGADTMVSTTTASATMSDVDSSIGNSSRISSPRLSLAEQDGDNLVLPIQTQPLRSHVAAHSSGGNGEAGAASVPTDLAGGQVRVNADLPTPRPDLNNINEELIKLRNYIEQNDFDLGGQDRNGNPREARRWDGNQIVCSDGVTKKRVPTGMQKFHSLITKHLKLVGQLDIDAQDYHQKYDDCCNSARNLVDYIHREAKARMKATAWYQLFNRRSDSTKEAYRRLQNFSLYPFEGLLIPVQRQQQLPQCQVPAV